MSAAELAAPGSVVAPKLLRLRRRVLCADKRRLTGSLSRDRYSFVKSQAPALLGVGGVGGVAQGLPLKSKNSVMSGMEASRAVSGCKPQRASMNLRKAV